MMLSDDVPILLQNEDDSFAAAQPFRLEMPPNQ
jgi:hypothetical protein